MSCKTPLEKEGSWVKIESPSGDLVASFPATEDMCKPMLKRMLAFKYNLEYTSVMVWVKSKQNWKLVALED